MKIYNLLCKCAALALLSFFGCNTPPVPQTDVIIPRPLIVEQNQGGIYIKNITRAYTNIEGKERDTMLEYLKQSPLQIEEITDKEADKTLDLIITPATQDTADIEKYTLQIKESGIRIESPSGTGLFYGLQSLIQLAVNNKDGYLPLSNIEDSPRFSYRGMMLDVSRHFYDKDFVKKQLDMMAYYKLNRFHWHLTDGAGWRIEIKKYPQLTDKAAYRPIEDYRKWTEAGKPYCTKDTPGSYGGYYTQEDIKEIVAYAAERYITVIPEIEMPGHSEEVLAVFPELQCVGGSFLDGDLCIGNEQTFTFLENVLTEVMELFPSQYIHIGGDEANKKAWRNCPKCKKRMADEKLKNVDELQSYMIHRIEVFLNKNNRKLLGWDEILEGGLAPNAAVMSWRGETGGIAAAKAGHDVIMTPNGYCYFDSYQASPTTQPEAMSGYVPLRKVYSYNPVSDVFTPEESKYVIGVQANLWTEYMRTPEQTEYMIWPRLLALAEVAWSQPDRMDYDSFHTRALQAVAYLQDKGYHPFNLSADVELRPESQTDAGGLARGKQVTYKTPYHEKYKANNEQTLTDGKRGTWSYSDGIWQGFLDSDMDVTIDLGKVQPIHAVTATFMQDYLGWIWMPAYVEISASQDGKEFKLLEKIENKLPFEQGGFYLENFGWKGNTDARYVRYLAKSSGKRVGGWIFTDEIIVE